MAHIDHHVRIRGTVRKSITDLFNARNTFSQLDNIQRETRKIKLKTYSDRLQTLNNQIQNNDPEN